ncbi:BA75_04063T0 [Komagataella pastoris]|uniref:BA75_04063T0 n=1 Tax=Komagataella pastoris TaxID=4922 RepID=A0A1B2JEG4_PICPA|nr:BA75_04063T0 [Komagataella pastoris]
MSAASLVGSTEIVTLEVVADVKEELEVAMELVVGTLVVGATVEDGSEEEWEVDGSTDEEETELEETVLEETVLEEEVSEEEVSEEEDAEEDDDETEEDDDSEEEDSDEDSDEELSSKLASVPTLSQTSSKDCKAVEDNPSGQVDSKQDCIADPSFSQIHWMLFKASQSEESLTTSAAQANRQAGGVATAGLARAAIRETTTEVEAKVNCIFSVINQAGMSRCEEENLVRGIGCCYFSVFAGLTIFRSNWSRYGQCR